MRSVFFLLSMALIGQDPAVRDLIQNLEDDRVESREQAQKELAARGESALPVLREVVESSRSSGELKLRAAATIRDIEMSLKAAKVYREPPRMTFKAVEDPLREVLEEISAQTRLAINASAVDGAAKMTVEEKDVSLFVGLDLL